MSKGAAPLRFLALVIGGWICVRGAFLASEWDGAPTPDEAALAEASIPPDVSAPPRQPTQSPAAGVSRTNLFPFAAHRTVGITDPIGPGRARRASSVTPLPSPALTTVEQVEEDEETAPATAPMPAAAPLLSPPATSRRWSGSAWAFVRRGDARQLSAGGTLGGSQIGGRILYRLTEPGAAPLSASGRLYASLEHPAESEAALGIEWQPASHVPIRILAERRQAIGRDGRSAFAVLAYGGSSKTMGRLQADLYGQAGIVGIRSHDAFADGSARISWRLTEANSLRTGAGVWAATQPGVSRVDVGPSLSLQIAPHLAIAADWRLRVAGRASPRSGPSLTLSTDF